MSYIEVECESCEKLHKINKSEFEFESIEVSERQMGAEVT